MNIILTNLLLCLFASIASSEVLYSTDDTTTKLDKPENKNAGDDDYLRIRHSGTNDRDVYIKFDFDAAATTNTYTSANVDTSEVQLGLYLESLSTGSNGKTKSRITVTAFHGAEWDDSWSEDTFTWNQADALLATATGWPIATRSVYGKSVGNPLSFNVPVNILPGCDMQLQAGETCTLSGNITFQLVGDSDSTVKLPSRDSSGNQKPVLSIIGTAPAPPTASPP